MASRYLLDTNICIYIHRERPDSVRSRFLRLDPGSAVISVVTWGELRYGAERSSAKTDVMALLDEFVAFVPVLPLPDAAGPTYGALRAKLAKAGTPIGNNDLWIAAHALAEGLVLVTNNEREFRRIPGLKAENWAA